ncbi:MAG: hypothetical protein M3281_03240 [Chloroflexota bacterium]|nr:hypothetical protein [Chloroflexota bacterium]
METRTERYESRGELESEAEGLSLEGWVLHGQAKDPGGSYTAEFRRPTAIPQPTEHSEHLGDGGEAR